MNEVHVATEEEAQALNFIGSPTVRINGEDIESQIEQQRGRIHGSCRMYHYEGKIFVTPHKEFIRAAPETAVFISTNNALL
ncbi:MAG: DUF2703 domain-containing protein [Euryarchaeota archaeon]|nr:DUF2703 domain-containing protein [Euryarchaeota archaeon]